MQTKLIMLLLFACPTCAYAGPFDPPVSALCAKSAPLVVNKAMLLKQLFAYEKIGDDLDQSPRDVTYERRKDALLHPDNFCNTSDCAKGVPAKLGQAVVDLEQYLVSHARAPTDASKGYVLTSNVSSDPQLVSKFLSGTPGAAVATCVPATSKPARPPEPTRRTELEAKKNDDLPVRFAVRKNIDDLVYSNDSDKFKGLDPANFSVTNDFVKHSNAYAVDIALGVPIGPGVLGKGVTGQIIPFLTYNQNYVEGPSNPSKVFNLGAGITSDVLFPMFGIYHDLQFYPKIVHSFSTGANILTANLVYEPQPDWPLIGQVYYFVPGMLSAQLTPQLIFVYGNVLNDGGDITLLQKGNFERVGPKLALAVYGEGALDGYTYNLSYEILKVFQGPLSSVSRFETSVNYTLSQLPTWTVQLKYVDGRNLDTLQQQRQITLGLGLKY
jgi:hypothetical protein